MVNFISIELDKNRLKRTQKTRQSWVVKEVYYADYSACDAL